MDDTLAQQHHVQGRNGCCRRTSRLGWKEIGRWPGALRLATDDRDEILMFLSLR